MEKDIKKIKEEKKPSSKHLFAYLRVSTLKQEIENQTSEIKRYCQKHNLGTIPEARWISATMSSRKSQAERRIEELLSKLNKGDSLIVTETSRLGRSTGEVLMLIDDLVEKGITIIVTKKDEVINKENRNKLTANLTLHALFAELERDIISQRTKEALAYRKEQGQPIGRPAGEPTKSIYDDKLEDIKDLLAKDVPLNVISRILAVGKPLSLRRFLMKKNLLVYKRIRVKPGTRK